MKIKTLLTILCVCFSINLHSQEGEIIYTDFEPDSTFVVPYKNYNFAFDINNDGDNDFTFYYDGTSAGYPYVIECLGSEYPWNWQVGYALNDTIPNIPTHYWHIFRVFANASLVPYEGLYEEKELEIAIRHDLDDTSSCYGWIRFQFKYGWGIPGTVILYDMAYCTVPNYPLRVGQKCFNDTPINDTSEFKDYVLFPSPANDKITLKFNNHYYNTTDNEIKIYGIDGRLLKTQNSDFDNIDISNLTSGVYIMKIYLGNGENYTEKFVKE